MWSIVDQLPFPCFIGTGICVSALCYAIFNALLCYMLDIGITRYIYSRSVTHVFTLPAIVNLPLKSWMVVLHCTGLAVWYVVDVVNFFATLSCVNHMLVLLAMLSCHCLLNVCDLWSCAWLCILYFVSWLPVAAGMLTCAVCVYVVSWLDVM